MANSYSKQTVIKSMAWIFSGNVFNAAMSFVASIFVVRFLSVYDYGEVQFVLSIFAIVQVSELLVHSSILKKKLLEHPEKSFEYVRSGAQIVMMCAAGLAVVFISLYWILKEHIYLYLFVLSLGYFFKAINNNVFSYYEVHLRLKESQLPQSISYLIANVFKVVIARFHPIAFWQIASVPFFNISSTFFALRRFELKRKLREYFVFDRVIAKELFQGSLFLFFTGFATLVFYKIDTVILGITSTKENISYYSNAVKLSEPWSVVAFALISTYLPVILVTKKKSLRVYYYKIRNLFSALFVLAVLIGLGGTIFAGEVVTLAFGQKYLPVIPILRVHIWSNIFLFWLSAQHIWEVSEDMTIFALWKSIAAAVLNIILNVIFIPKFGAMACAVNSLITYFCAAVGFNLFHQKTRFLLKQQLRSLIEIPAVIVNVKKQLFE